jgi:hypothetical protein
LEKIMDDEDSDADADHDDDTDRDDYDHPAEGTYASPTITIS